MNSTFERHFLGPLIVLSSLALGEIGVRYLNFPITLAVPYALLSLTIFRWSGLRAALVSALLISLYPFLFHYEQYGFWRALIAALGVFLIAAPSGILKRGLRETAIEAERLHLLAEARAARAEIAEAVAPNGNRAKIRAINEMLIGLIKDLDKIPPETVKKSLYEIQNHLSNALTVFDLWHGLAEDRRQALLKLEEDFREAHGYDFRVSEEIQSIKQLQKEALSRIYEIERQGKREDR